MLNNHRSRHAAGGKRIRRALRQRLAHSVFALEDVAEIVLTQAAQVSELVKKIQVADLIDFIFHEKRDRIVGILCHVGKSTREIDERDHEIGRLAFSTPGCDPSLFEYDLPCRVFRPELIYRAIRGDRFSEPGIQQPGQFENKGQANDCNMQQERVAESANGCFHMLSSVRAIISFCISRFRSQKYAEYPETRTSRSLCLSGLSRASSSVFLS